MGLDDLVDQKESTEGSPDQSDPSTTGEEQYFNNTAKKTRGTIDRIKDSIEVRGQDRGNHTLYLVITECLKVRDGVIYDDNNEEVVEVSRSDYRINSKEIRVMVGDKSQQKLCYEIRVK